MLHTKIRSCVSRAIVLSIFLTLVLPLTVGIQSAFADAPCKLSQDGKRMICSEGAIPAPYEVPAHELDEAERAVMADFDFYDFDQIEGDLVTIYGDDECDEGYEIGFDFEFYGETYDEVAINTNGTVELGSPEGCFSEYSNSSYYNGEEDYPDNLLMPFFDDQVSLHWGVYTATVGDEIGARQFVIQFTNHYHLYSVYEGIEDNPYTAPVGTYQVILDEATGAIQYQYLYLMNGRVGRGSLATIGLVGDFSEDEIIHYSYNEDVLTSGQAISFTPDGEGGYTVDDDATVMEYYLTGLFEEYPELTTPADGAEEVGYEPTFDWEDVPMVDYYNFYVASSSDFETGLANGDDDYIANSIVYYQHEIEESELDLSLELDEDIFVPGGTYHWFVMAVFEGEGDVYTISDSVHSFTVEVAEDFSGSGAGTEGDPYLITSCDELIEINNHLDDDYYYLLTTDLNCVPAGNDARVGSSLMPFIGTFDGDDHTITVDIDFAGDFVGLFARIQESTITDLHVAGDVVGEQYTGGLVGLAYDSAISGSSSSVDVFSVTDAGIYQANHVGGLVGFFVDGVATDLSASGSVSGNYENIGGLFGAVQDATVSDSYATGAVTGSGYDVGGFAGDIDDSTVQDCYATGDVVHETYFDEEDEEFDGGYSGGFVGDSDGDALFSRSYATGNVTSEDVFNVGGFMGGMQDGVVIEESFATGDVLGGDHVGGFVGNIDFEGIRSGIENSYATGSVTGNEFVGGFGGSVEAADILNVYSVGLVTGAEEDNAGGLIGGQDVEDEGDSEIEASFWDTQTSELEFSDGGEGLPTADMKTQVTFTNEDWDFDDIWSIAAGTNNGYPYLQNVVVEDEDAPVVGRQIISSGGSGGTVSKSSNSDGDPSYLDEIQAVKDRGIVTKEFTKTADKCESLVIMSRAFGWSLTNATTSQFTDVPEWCAPAANFAVANGIVEGRSEGLLGLDTPVTRYEVAVMLYRELKRQGFEFAGTVSFSFSDSLVDWAREAVEALAAEGFIKGFGNGTFGGDQGILKQDLGVMVLRINS